jgi:hypothetical protein
MLTPSGSTGIREQNRQAVNQWIRTSGVFDAVVDFDVVTRDGEPTLSCRRTTGIAFTRMTLDMSDGRAIDLNLIKVFKQPNARSGLRIRTDETDSLDLAGPIRLFYGSVSRRKLHTGTDRISHGCHPSITMTSTIAARRNVKLIASSWLGFFAQPF